MTLHELRVELLAIATEAESGEELIGALEELLKRAQTPEKQPQEPPAVRIVAPVA